MEYNSSDNSGYTSDDDFSETSSQPNSQDLYKFKFSQPITTFESPSSKMYTDELSNYSSDSSEPLIPLNEPPKKFDTKKFGSSPSIFFNPLSRNAKANQRSFDCLVDVFKKTTKYVQVEYSIEMYNNVYREIGDFVMEEKSCVGLTQNYVRGSLDQADAIIIVGPVGFPLFKQGDDSSQLNVEGKVPIYAFSTLFFKTQEYVKTDVICSMNSLFSGAGAEIMNVADDVAKVIWAKKIKLESVNTAVSFYKKFGFKEVFIDRKTGLTQMEKPTGLCPMAMDVPGRGGKKRKTIKLKTKKVKKTKRVKKTKKVKKIKRVKKTKRV